MMTEHSVELVPSVLDQLHVSRLLNYVLAVASEVVPPSASTYP